MSQPISFRQRLAKNTAASMATNLWTIVLTIGSLPIILHGLGAKAFGVWVFLQTFSATNGWLSVPATGLSVSATRRVASSITDSDPRPRLQATGTALAAFALAGVVFGVALGWLTPTILDRALDLDGAGGTSLRLLGVAFGVQLLAEHVCLALTSVVEGIQEVALARLIDATRKTAMAVGAAAVAAAGGDLQDVAVVTAAAASVVTLGALLRLRQLGHLAIGRPGAAEMRSMLRYAGTVSALTGTGVLHRTMDRTIAGIAFGPGAVALVEIANQIQAGGTALLSASTYPVLSAAPWLDSADDGPRLRALFDRATRYSVLLTLPVVVLTIALAGPFVPRVGGRQLRRGDRPRSGCGRVRAPRGAAPGRFEPPPRIRSGRPRPASVCGVRARELRGQRGARQPRWSRWRVPRNHRECSDPAPHAEPRHRQLAAHQRRALTSSHDG